MKKKKKKIQDFDKVYAVAKPIVNFTFKLFYNKIYIDGKENIPDDKTTILAPNHQNALMDALAILMTQRGQPVFLARADIFKQKLAAWILEGVNILPVYRERDGREELGRNQNIFEQAVDVLRDDVILCLMPEGVQTSKRSLLPLVKGMFRIALSAQEELSDREIVIVPVGIDYEDYVEPGKELIIRFGKPISMQDYMPLYKEQPAKALNVLRKDLSEKMSELIQNIRSVEYYDTFYNISLIADASVCPYNDTSQKPLELLKTRQKISVALDREEQENPQAIERLDRLYKEYAEGLKKLKIKDAVFDKKQSPAATLFKSLLLLVSLPFYLAGVVGNLIPSLIADTIVGRLKGDGFKSSFKIVLWLLLFPIYYIILLVILSLVFRSFLIGLGIIAALIALGRFAVFYKRWAQDNLGMLRFLIRKKRYPEAMQKIANQRAEIISIIRKML